MYVETTHGWYDTIPDLMGVNKSILPMNVNVQYWGDTFSVTRKSLHDPFTNIITGASIIRGIQQNLPPNSSVPEVATLYNNLRALKVSDYGARVEHVYSTRPWLNGDW